MCTNKPADRTPQRHYYSLYWTLTAGLQGDIITADNGLTSYALGYKLSHTQPVAEQTYCVGDWGANGLNLVMHIIIRCSDYI